MGLNTCRICMGASDYATELYGYDEGSGMEIRIAALLSTKPLQIEVRELSSW